MKILIITDAWSPQINGVVRTLTTTKKELEKLGHEAVVVEPSQFKSFPTPFYKEIPICYGIKNIESYIKPPCAIHIATEGSLGLAFNWFCRNNKIPFTTSYHTNYPDYIWKYLKIPSFLTYAYLKWFHSAAIRTMMSTPTLEKKMIKKGFKNIKRWSRGVDTELFKPICKFNIDAVCLYVGRVAKEKNIKAFLDVDVKVKKVVVGDGPHLKTLKKKYPHISFLGALHGEELAKVYSSSDCFVFPSKTDTFGLVLIEALASGLPIAAYPVEGPIDIWNGENNTGCLDSNLEVAIKRALMLGQPEACRNLALQYTWEKCTLQFLNNLELYQG